ncbi:DNA-binding protein [Streptomyces sp. NPDC021218]|uniref:DNA-binding protein n=1 Tax=Streptomyces sp. NPDC021218 TaxID=3365119 RepID=UPI0037B79347
MTTAVRRTALTIADLYGQPPLMALWPTFGRDVCLLAESTTYQLAAENRLPVETVRLGRKRFVRTADVIAWLHLPQNDDSAAGATATPSVEHISETAAQQIEGAQ